MPSRPLRGERYAKGVRPGFIRMLTDSLPFYTFDETLGWYLDYWNRLPKRELALLGCNDRFFLLTVLLNRKDALHPWLYDRCREVEARSDGFLDLWARFHYKSTIITFAGAIQEVLCDPEIRIGIFSNTIKISRPFLGQIMEELEGNEPLRQIYSDVLWANPKKEAPSWGIDRGLTVKRKGNPKEASIEAHGLIDAMPTGRHFPLLIYDDVINEKNVGNPEQIKKATERFEMSDNLGVVAGTRKWAVGTRYSYADSYGQMIDAGILTPRLYPATEDGTLNGKPVLLSQEVWDDKKRAQRSTISAQMLQNPIAGQENVFKAEWLQPYWVRPRMMNVYLMGDPSRGRHKTSDRTAFAVVGIDSGWNKYLLDGYCHRMSLSERWRALRDLHKRWSNMHGVQLLKVGYERYGQQSDDEYFEERMRAEGIRFTIEELNWTYNRGMESKGHRVERLEPDFRMGSFFLPGKVWHPGIPLGLEVQKRINEGKIPKPVNPNTVTWAVSDDGQVTYRPYVGANEFEREARHDGDLWRLIQPIRRVDEDGNIYDLTRVFFEEYLFFPFSPRDDLIDATSRIYDMKPTNAGVHERYELPDYPDA